MTYTQRDMEYYLRMTDREPREWIAFLISSGNTWEEVKRAARMYFVTRSSRTDLNEYLVCLDWDFILKDFRPYYDARKALFAA